MSEFALRLGVRDHYGVMDAVVRSAQGGGRKNRLWKEMSVTEGFVNTGQ